MIKKVIKVKWTYNGRTYDGILHSFEMINNILNAIIISSSDGKIITVDYDHVEVINLKEVLNIVK